MNEIRFFITPDVKEDIVYLTGQSTYSVFARDQRYLGTIENNSEKTMLAVFIPKDKFAAILGLDPSLFC